MAANEAARNSGSVRKESDARMTDAKRELGRKPRLWLASVLVSSADGVTATERDTIDHSFATRTY